MANIATGLNKRGHRNLYEGNYASAVECFFRGYLLEPENQNNILDLIYALNQNADYATALTFCYGLLGANIGKKALDTLYFLTAEAFGGVGCVDGCAQMLEKCLKENPEGSVSKDALAFLTDLKKKHDVGKYDVNSNAVTLGMPNGITEAPFLNYETLVCMQEIGVLIKEEKLKEALNRVEKEIDTGNVNVSLLGVAIMLGAEIGDKDYVMRNAERFKFVEDYTTSELHALAYNLSELNDEDVAYTVFRELYSKESGEKDIAFGFSVACERIGDFEYAKRLVQGVISSQGGIGPATYYEKELGKKTHSYMLKYENEAEESIISNIKTGNFNSRSISLAETLDYLNYCNIELADECISKVDTDKFLGEMELRRLAINPKASLFVRAKAASRIADRGVVYLNTGSDFVEFSPEIAKVINNFFERGMNNEGTN